MVQIKAGYADICSSLYIALITARRHRDIFWPCLIMIQATSRCWKYQVEKNKCELPDVYEECISRFEMRICSDFQLEIALALQEIVNVV